MANTHTESNITSLMMTGIYKQSKKIIKDHVNANEEDVVLLDGFGMTSVMNKLQRILGVRVPEKWKDQYSTNGTRKTHRIFNPYGASLEPNLLAGNVS